ncbi:MAG: hemolysin III family protein [Acidimicrobiia bacterium]
MERMALGPMQNPVRGFLHGTAGLLSVVGLVALVSRASGRLMVFACAVYGLTLIGMYMTSAAYHSVPWRPIWKARLQRLDHTMIYVLVAGTATPLLVALSPDLWRGLGLCSIWALVLCGMARELSPGRSGRVWLRLEFVAAAMAVVPFAIALAHTEYRTAALIIAGGVTYLTGVALFVNDRPRLAPRVFSHHEFFHVMVILASVTHFWAVWRVVA